MGVLYNSVKMQKQMKRNFILEQLRAKGITHSQTGTRIDDLTYDDLKYELVLASFRDIDVEKQESKWF